MEGSISPISSYLEFSRPALRSEITAGYRLMYFFGWTLLAQPHTLTSPP
jgi:hypothetical protein